LIKSNVFKDVKEPLELHQDARGRIADIFYKENIEHVAIIDSVAGALRGDHWHKHTEQHMLMTKGVMEYWHKRVDSDEPAICGVLYEGDIVTTPPNEIHALRMITDQQFIVFTTGRRGGKDYESDTFRVQPTIIPQESGLKIHLGCGKRYLPGYVHVDVDDFPHITYKHDIASLPMFDDGSADILYSCGALPYFDRCEVMDVLKEWYRVLKKGGILRLSVPDFDSIIRIYIQSDRDLSSLGVLGPLYGRWHINTASGKTLFYHKTVYNFRALSTLLESIGFGNVRREDWQNVMPSGYDDYSMAYVPHMDKENGILLSLNVECEKV